MTGTTLLGEQPKLHNGPQRTMTLVRSNFVAVVGAGKHEVESTAGFLALPDRETADRNVHQRHSILFFYILVNNNPNYRIFHSK